MKGLLSQCSFPLLTAALNFLLFSIWVTSAKAYERDWLCNHPLDEKAERSSVLRTVFQEEQ